MLVVSQVIVAACGRKFRCDFCKEQGRPSFGLFRIYHCGVSLLKGEKVVSLECSLCFQRRWSQAQSLVGSWESLGQTEERLLRKMVWSGTR